MNRKISVQLIDVSTKSWSFEGLREFKEFCESEAEFWQEQESKAKEYNDDLDIRFNFNNKFRSVINTIDNWGEDQKSWDDNQVNNEVRALIQTHLPHANTQWLWSGHPYTKNFIDCQIKYGKDSAEAFLKLIINNNSQAITSGPHFYGVLLAYEFLNQDSDITKRSKSEQASLDHLRDELVEARTKLFGEVEDFKSDFDTWYSDTKNDQDKARYNYRRDSVTDRRRYSKKHIKIFREAKEKRSELEKTYQELLRLKEPAKYWNDAARKYRWQGCLYLLVITLLLLAGIFYFSDFFRLWIQGQQLEIQLNTIQGIVIFGTFAAVYAYLIRVFSKLVFSSFHLMRDAEEREQLTYLYLSLIKESAVDEKSREIVLQALFSRTDTGLLGQDSGPTMPAGVVRDLIKKAK